MNRKLPETFHGKPVITGGDIPPHPEVIISPWAIEVWRHPSDPSVDQLVIVESFNWIHTSDKASHPEVYAVQGTTDSVIHDVLKGIVEKHNAEVGLGGHAVWAVGTTPMGAVRGLAKHRGMGEVTEIKIRDGECSDEQKFDWMGSFLANGTWCKCAGRNVPGGVVLTWWK